MAEYTANCNICLRKSLFENYDYYDSCLRVVCYGGVCAGLLICTDFVNLSFLEKY